MIITSRTIEKLRNRDEETFEAIYNEYQKLIYYICFSITNDRTVSEDLVQETFLKLLSVVDAYQHDGKFKQFITEIARNLALNYVTRITNREQKLAEGLYVEDVVSSEDDKTNMLILDLQGLLEHDEADIVVLKIVYDYKFREIADYKKMTIGETQAKYYKALEKVKKAVEKGELSL